MFVQRYLQEFSEDPLVEAACTISSVWNAKLSAEKQFKNSIMKKRLVKFYMGFKRSHMHEKPFKKILQDRGINWGKTQN